MTATAVSTRPDLLIDPVTGQDTWTHELTGRAYVPQSLRGYLFGRVLDIAIVAAAVFALTRGAAAALQSTSLMTQEWQSVTASGLILLSVIFLYGGAAGTIGTLGERLTGMRVVNIDDGTTPGFRAGGLRAVGWFLCVIFTLLLSSAGTAETRYVAVRTTTGVYRGGSPVPAAKAPEPHTDQS